MPYYRRLYRPGGSVFFTVVTAGRAPILCQGPAPDLLRRTFRGCLSRWPFAIDAIVVLPDHLHAVWTLPADDVNYSRRWGWIKKEFAKAWIDAGGPQQDITPSQRQHGRLGVWQRRYWEHTLRDETDYERHIDYIHVNPVKHGLVARARDWPFSSLHRAVKRGEYLEEWGVLGMDLPSFDEIADTAAE